MASAYALARSSTRFHRSVYKHSAIPRIGHMRSRIDIPVSRIDINPLMETEVPQCKINQEMIEFPPAGKGAFIFLCSENNTNLSFQAARSESNEWRVFFNSRYYKPYITFVTMEEPVLPFGITYDNYNDIAVHNNKEEIDRIVDWMFDKR
jgi:hypothetical protein